MKLPADATKTALAETIALRAKVWARNHNGGLVTRLVVEEAITAVGGSPRYQHVPLPAYRTVFTQVRKICVNDPDITLKLAVTDPENRI